MMMSTLTAGNQRRAALTAPAVALAYTLIAFLVTRVGCTPSFSDVDFFGAPVTFFLVLAVTASALLLIVFAGLGALRALRLLRRRRRRSDLMARHQAAIGVVLALVAFIVSLGIGIYFLRAPCP